MSGKSKSSAPSSKKGTKSAPPSPAAGLLTSKRGRWLTAIVCIAGLVSVGAYGLWVHVRPHVLSSEAYMLQTEGVELTPLPAWIRADVKAQVLRDSGLDEPQSILDDDLVERVAKAFSLHPWVAEVTRVTKQYPARVRVEVVYREPTALVQVSGGWLAVDALGVWLPSADFSRQDVRRYPHITGIESRPSGPEGTQWGDPRVSAAAAIAAAIHEVWTPLGLSEIRPLNEGAPATVDTNQYEIVTQQGSRVLWGSPPGTEQTGEPLADAKLEWLAHVASQRQSLEPKGVPQVYDLRQPGETQETAHRLIRDER
jgi:hypothetical protein